MYYNVVITVDKFCFKNVDSSFGDLVRKAAPQLMSVRELVVYEELARNDRNF